MVNHECDMLMHGQPVTQRLSELVYISQFSYTFPWHSYVTKIPLDRPQDPIELGQALCKGECGPEEFRDSNPSSGVELRP